MARGFDRLAQPYVWLEYLAFGRTLARARGACLLELSVARRVLILGEGDGRFLKALLNTNPNCRVDCFDKSQGMLERARTRLSPAAQARTQFIHADAAQTPFAGAPYDAVVTLFFLDCLNQETLRTLIPRISASLRPAGLWFLADFQIPPCGWQRAHAQAWLWLLYRFFRLTTDIEASRWHDPKPHMAHSGLQLRRDITFRGALLTSQLYQKTP